jgi:hypothetical protein
MQARGVHLCFGVDFLSLVDFLQGFLRALTGVTKYGLKSSRSQQITGRFQVRHAFGISSAPVDHRVFQP